MKWIKCTLLVAVVLGTFAAYATAGCDANPADVTISGQARYRMEIDGKTFDSNVNSDWTQYMRTRIGFNAQASSNAGAFIQIQDSRILGMNPGTTYFNNNTGVFETGVHQAYLWYKPCDKGWAKVGRMSVGLHNERLVGKVGWSNIGRTEEGLMFNRKLNDSVNITGAAFQLQENNLDDADGNRYTDPMFYIFDLNLADQGVDLFAYYLRDESWYNLNTDSANGNSDLWTFGTYSSRTFADSWFYNAMFALQTGSFDVSSVVDGARDTTSIDRSGMLINVEIGNKFDNGMKISGLLDYTTGDDATTDGEIETFNNLLYTGHKWNGYMDYFVGGRAGGLMDVALRFAYPLESGWMIKFDSHYFSSAEDYNKLDQDGLLILDDQDNPLTANALGTEFDFAVKKTDGPFSIEGGLGIFSPSNDWVEGGDSGTWGYIQSMVNF